MYALSGVDVIHTLQEFCLDAGSLPYKIYIEYVVVPAPDGTIYLVDINGTRYWGLI